FLGREMTETRDFSEQTARVIDEEVKKIIKNMEDRSIGILRDNQDALVSLAEALMKKETLMKDEIDEAIKKEKPSAAAFSA
ncbi:MAG: cell division protein FtsH, partial [Desulfobacterales bacterium]